MQSPVLETTNSRVTFEWRVTFGNVLTIIGGIVVAGTLLGTIVSYASSIQNKVDSVSDRVDAVECGLANAGVLPTTARCTLAARASR